MKTSKLLHKYKVSIIFSCVLVLAFYIQTAVLRIPTIQVEAVKTPKEYIGLSIDPKIVRRLLGLRIMVADLVWIDALIKADVVHENKDFTSMYQAAKTIVQLDPDNIYAYYTFGLYLSVIKDDIKGATAILRDGAQHIQELLKSGSNFSNNFYETAWRVYFTLGYNLLFEEHEFEEGSEWIKDAAQFDNTPQYLKELAQHVSTEQGQLEIGSKILNDTYLRVSSSEEKKAVELKLLFLAYRQEILELNANFERFLYTTSAHALPKRRAFTLFMRSIHHSGKDILGHKLDINDLGNIYAIGARKTFREEQEVNPNFAVSAPKANTTSTEKSKKIRKSVRKRR